MNAAFQAAALPHMPTSLIAYEFDRGQLPSPMATKHLQVSAAHLKGGHAALVCQDDIAAPAIKADAVQCRSSRLPEPYAADTTEDRTAAALQRGTIADVNACGNQVGHTESGIRFAIT